MYADTTFSDESGVYYRAKSDGSLYMNEWYYNYTYKCWMYYGSGRTYYTDGIYEINNTLYYFDKFGSMVTSGVYTLNDEKYVAQKDGSLTKNARKWLVFKRRKILLYKRWRNRKEKNIGNKWCVLRI